MADAVICVEMGIQHQKGRRLKEKITRKREIRVKMLWSTEVYKKEAIKKMLDLHVSTIQSRVWFSDGFLLL